ncbi:MAG: hypothetical protein D6725_16970 [Planctomycetota bacterium]|nr:MAG: hypothetical protein D6725_16970 [Planctomycetota bacterium]
MASTSRTGLSFRDRSAVTGSKAEVTEMQRRAVLRAGVWRAGGALSIGAVIAGAVLFWGVWRGEALGQSGTRGSGSARRYAAQPASVPFERKFWDWLQSVHYRNWAPVPGQTGEATAGQSPHGAFVKMYLNRTAAGHPNELPNGSIIVKENYGPDGKTLMAVTVMYRSRGFDPQHGDWYWVKYGADGTVAYKNAMKLAGRVKGCIECHQGADGGDWAFFNDR